MEAWRARLFARSGYGLVMLAAVAMPLLQTGGPAAPRSDLALIEELMADPRVRSALDAVRAGEAWVLDEQVRLCEIPAPPFQEAERARAYRAAFEALGLQNVRIDPEGNVIGERPGTTGAPRVVVSAHLDTVFPPGTDVRVRRDGTVLTGPGIGDDCRGLAVVLGVIRALAAARVETPGTILFVGTVGEEGLGDLRGVRHLFEKGSAGRIDRFVSIDGAGFGITHIAVGSLRYRVTFKGPGGHSYGAFGLANPVHASGRAIARIADFEVPREPKTTFNVGRIGGGTSVNAIAFEAWFEIDMRSADPEALKGLDARFHAAVDEALAAENRRWGDRGRLEVTKALVGRRPAGRTPAGDPVVGRAAAATGALGLPVSLDEGSTDANLPISLGIPAITLDGGGRGGGAHSLGETFDAADSWKGTARALLVTIALARP
ncbi:MAG TPA: M20/M25/M40 family metallo-hydrolase [Vicinamibacterales bacterium]|nr:M20/M25/M40 family metallo-hydrolase [Vicinamibacterales bacterium]